MLTVADIMTQPVTTLTPEMSLRDAHDITRQQGIRHLPIVDNDQLIGIVTQKRMISKVISLMTLYGNEGLAKHEGLTNIMEVAVKDFDTVSAEQSVRDVAPFFLKNKHGCLPVVNAEGTLVGILTSSDFVKLTISLLENMEN